MLDFLQNGFIARIAVAIRDREEGQAMVEYALILALVSVAAIVILGTVGTGVVTTLTSVAGSL
jgi:Flp pilus assembly pilin Flp